MFATNFLSRITSSTPQPLLPLSSTQSLQTPYTDIPNPSPTDTTATLLALARQEAHLQSHIQYLLNIQSDRLLEGLGGKATAEPSSHSKFRSNPNPKDIHHHASSAGNRARELQSQTPPTLRGARRQISTAISDLHTLKSQTADLARADLTATVEEHKHITSLQTKKSQLEATIAELESSPTSKEIDALTAEEEALDKKIYELENQLYELKARRGAVKQRVRERKNKVEARISSWKGSLEILGKEEEGVLARGPVVSAGGGNTQVGKGKGNGATEAEREGNGTGESVWDLPPKRRTLTMVGEFYEHESAGLRKRLEDVEMEARALDEGKQVWEDVVREVEKVEGSLEGELKGLAEYDGGDAEEQRINGMKRVLEAMAQTRERVGRYLKMAEEKGWNLLVVCVGAELEALVEGEEVLRSVLGVEGGGVDGVMHKMNGGNGKSGGGEQEMAGEKGMVEDTEDDEPGPELLLSAPGDVVNDETT
ncbi:MAG: hypothetical protein LQ337_002534 [Flavoplaca oasis]|nr:MAG: hypothetical protein LQ337_002534 [Flavoplaca oasis]